MPDVIAQCEILAVGTEILLGTTLDTNTRRIAKLLSDLGLSCRYHTTVGDNPDRLARQLETSLSRSDCILMSGGLGPTTDDMTMAVAAEVAGIPLVFHEAVWREIQAYFARSGRTTAPNNRKQAMLPEGQTIIPNANGTAPGAIMRFTRDGSTCHLILLPGPPKENVPMLEETVRPYLEARSAWRMVHRFLHLIDIGEADAADAVRDLIDAQDETTLAPYAHDGEMQFRLTRRYRRAEDPREEAANRQAAEEDMDVLEAKIRERLGDYIYEVGERSLPELVVRNMIRENLSFSFAESLTGGKAAAEAASVPGVSAVFKGAIVAYREEMKQELLDVPASVLDEHGAVSEETAEAMAVGCRRHMGSDYAVSLTGLAGPDGDGSGQPVGRTYIAVAGPDGCDVAEYTFTGSREKIRSAAAVHAFNRLRLRLQKDGNWTQKPGGACAGDSPRDVSPIVDTSTD